MFRRILQVNCANEYLEFPDYAYIELTEADVSRIIKLVNDMKSLGISEAVVDDCGGVCFVDIKGDKTWLTSVDGNDPLPDVNIPDWDYFLDLEDASEYRLEYDEMHVNNMGSIWWTAYVKHCGDVLSTSWIYRKDYMAGVPK